ncbi:taste receptor type 2 member 40-like [Gastrophryne carolinensis]
MLETVTGILTNGYIVIVNVVDLVVHKNLGSGDIILTFLGLSRFGFQGLVLAIFLFTYVYPSFAESQSSINKLQYVWLFFHSISIWLAALLSTFYCVRIVNMQQRAFVLLKTHFDRWLPSFLMISVIVSIALSNPYAYMGLNNFVNMSRFDKPNKTASNVLAGSDNTCFTIVSMMGSIPPFLLFSVSSGLVVGSLLRHVMKMKGQQRTGFREPSLQTHYRAVRMMGYFFLFFVCYTLAFNMIVSGELGQGFWTNVCNLVIGSYPSLHSVILVVGNHKLKQTFIKILQKGKCYRKDVAQTETLET